jgi:hypothetical protein
MLQVFKILQGHDNVKVEQWFKTAADCGGRTRQVTGCLIYIVKPRANLEAGANFFSVRAMDSRNVSSR